MFRSWITDERVTVVEVSKRKICVFWFYSLFCSNYGISVLVPFLQLVKSYNRPLFLVDALYQISRTK